MIMRALSFWKTRLVESKNKTVESEEDQKKEAAKAQADEEQAEIDAAEEDAGDDAEDTDVDIGDVDTDTAEDIGDDAEDAEDAENAEDTDTDTAEDTAEDTGDGDGFGFDSDTAFDPAIGDEGDMEDNTGDDDGEDDGEDGGDEDDSAEEDDDDVDDDDDDDSAEGGDEDDEDDDGESEFKLEITAPSKKLLDAIPDLCKKFGSKVSITVAGLDPEGDDEEGGYVTAIECQDEETLNAVKEEDAVKEAVGGMDGELNESLQYEPNTVGAVIKLLSQSDPRDFLFIRLAPNMKQCMIYDIDRKVMVKGQSTTYLEIAIGDPNK